MSYILNNDYKGFQLIKKENIPDFNSIGLLYRHEKTGAEIVHYARRRT